MLPRILYSSRSLDARIVDEREHEIDRVSPKASLFIIVLSCATLWGLVATVMTQI